MNEIEARLATLEQHLGKLLADNEHLRADNADLRAQLAGLRLAPMSPADHQPPVVADLPDDDTTHTERSATDGPRPVSRRGMIAAVAGVAGGVLLTQTGTAAATQGQAVLAGNVNTATAPTTVTSSSTALKGIATTTTTGYGVYGQADGIYGVGAYGYSGATSGTTKGVLGETLSPGGAGVHGRATATTGGGTGVLGETAGPSGAGVIGRSSDASYATGNVVGTGVRGESAGRNGIGVHGKATYTFPGYTAYGVRGEAASGVGVGGSGDTGVAGSGSDYGVYGSCPRDTGYWSGYALYGNGRLKATGRTYLGAPGTAPFDPDLDAGSVSMYLNEATDKLKIRVKYSNGTLKTATIALA